MALVLIVVLTVVLTINLVVDQVVDLVELPAAAPARVLEVVYIDSKDV